METKCNLLEAATDTERLFTHLHRGGRVAHLWTNVGHQSYWFRVRGCARCGARTIPRPWLAHDVYFSVHPLARIPPTSTGGSADPRYISSQLAYIASINALFAEYDGKDYVTPEESALFLPADFDILDQAAQRAVLRTAKEETFYDSPQRYKRRARAQIDTLEHPPSVIVDSGGGYHCYWLLRSPVPLDETNRRHVQAVQHTWVRMVGGDPGASDLRRILRVPGTYNHKPGFGASPPQVCFVKADFDLLYAYTELEEAANDWLFAQRAVAAKHREARPRIAAQGDVRADFDAHHRLVDLLVAHGYAVSYTTPVLTRLARPGRGCRRSSVTVFPSRDDGAPELSVHFSTNDELYCEEYLDAETGYVRRQAHDAFAVYALLEHGGDWRAAYSAIQAQASKEMSRNGPVSLLAHTDTHGANLAPVYEDRSSESLTQNRI